MVRLGTWNLENLFRPAPDASQETKDAYDAKLDALASLIKDMAPDLLAVQEVGEPEGVCCIGRSLAIKIFRRGAPQPAGRRPSALPPEHDGRL